MHPHHLGSPFHSTIKWLYYQFTCSGTIFSTISYDSSMFQCANLWQWVEVGVGYFHFGKSIIVDGHCSFQDLVCAFPFVLQLLSWVLVKAISWDMRYTQPPLLLWTLKFSSLERRTNSKMITDCLDVRSSLRRSILSNFQRARRSIYSSDRGVIFPFHNTQIDN